MRLSFLYVLNKILSVDSQVIAIFQWVLSFIISLSSTWLHIGWLNIVEQTVIFLFYSFWGFPIFLLTKAINLISYQVRLHSYVCLLIHLYLNKYIHTYLCLFVRIISTELISPYFTLLFECWLISPYRSLLYLQELFKKSTPSRPKSDDTQNYHPIADSLFSLIAQCVFMFQVCQIINL